MSTDSFIVTEEMVRVAISKAVELEIVPRNVSHVEYLKIWGGMRDVLQAALDEL